MIIGLAVLLNSAAIIAVAIMLAVLSRRYRQAIFEITETQAAIDSIMIGHGMPAIFAQRYGVDYVIDPSKVPPPDE